MRVGAGKGVGARCRWGAVPQERGLEASESLLNRFGMRLQPRRDRDEDRLPSRAPATHQSGWATAATSSAGRSCAVECEEGARCVIAGARTATRAALGERLHALLKPKWNSQRTITSSSSTRKPGTASFAPRKRRLGRIRAEPDSLVAFVASVVRPATTTSRRASAAPRAVTADGWAAEQPAGRPRTVRELGSLYNAYNVYNVYHAYNANA